MPKEETGDHDVLPVGVIGHRMKGDVEESKLLLGAREMDKRALSKIHDRYYPEIYRYAYHRTGDVPVAEDIASEVFLRLLNGLYAHRPPKTTLRGWLYGVASHLVADHFRRLAHLALPNFPSTHASPQVEAEKNIRQHQVRQAIRNLPVEQQEVLALRFGEGFSVEETANVMGKTVTAVKSLQFRAVETLRNRLGNENE